MIQKWKLMLARFPYGGQERTELVDWVSACNVWARRQDDIETMLNWRINDTPVTMCRNRAIMEAIQDNVDILIMVDNDMAPDIDREHPFLPAAFGFIKGRWHQAPTMISAPYLTAPPAEAPCMGRWRTNSDGYELATRLYTREEAAQFSGIQPVPLHGTGLMCLDMRIFTGFPVGDQIVRLAPPWFDYDWTNEYKTEKASTEDMYFSRNVTMLFAKYGLEVGFVDWDCWSYHVKTKYVGKPDDLTAIGLAQKLLAMGTQAPEIGAMNENHE